MPSRPSFLAAGSTASRKVVIVNKIEMAVETGD